MTSSRFAGPGYRLAGSSGTLSADPVVPRSVTHKITNMVSECSGKLVHYVTPFAEARALRLVRCCLPTAMSRPQDDRNQEATVYLVCSFPFVISRAFFTDLQQGNLDERCTDALVWELMLQAGPVGASFPAFFQ